MTDHFDFIRFEITRRYIELAESGYVDDKYLEKARVLVDAIETGKHKKAQIASADEPTVSFINPIGS